MARHRTDVSPPREPSPRPAHLSPLVPCFLLLAGGGLLFLDGLHPYRTFHKKRTWKPIQGQLVQPFERRHVVDPTQGRGTVHEYLERRPQKRIFEETVTVGWPMSRRKLMWRVRLTYTYRWKNTVLTKLGEEPHLLFGTEALAHEYLERRLQGDTLTVWVNPARPEEATAFLEYRRLWHVGVGLFGVGLGFVGLLTVMILGRSHRRREREALEKKGSN